MGCDIHTIVEIKVAPNKGIGHWHKVGRYYTIKTFRGELHIEHLWYNDRNYNEFAMLADVRNGRGFAGVEKVRGFVPIAEPRGTPTDASEEASKLAIEWAADGHSHSWLTLRELIGTPEYWDQTTQFTGDTEPTTYRDAAPNIHGQLIPSLQSLMQDYYFEMGAHTGPDLTEDDVRIVFFFDN